MMLPASFCVLSEYGHTSFRADAEVAQKQGWGGGGSDQQPGLWSACCAALRRAGGTMTAVMSAANEKAVEVFLREEIEYLDIVPLVAACCEAHKADLTARPSIDDIVAFDQWARDWTHEHAKTFKRSMATA